MLSSPTRSSRVVPLLEVLSILVSMDTVIVTLFPTRGGTVSCKVLKLLCMVLNFLS